MIKKWLGRLWRRVQIAGRHETLLAEQEMAAKNLRLARLPAQDLVSSFLQDADFAVVIYGKYVNADASWVLPQNVQISCKIGGRTPVNMRDLFRQEIPDLYEAQLTADKQR